MEVVVEEQRDHGIGSGIRVKISTIILGSVVEMRAIAALIFS